MDIDYLSKNALLLYMIKENKTNVIYYEIQHWFDFLSNKYNINFMIDFNNLGNLQKYFNVGMLGIKLANNYSLIDLQNELLHSSCYSQLKKLNKSYKKYNVDNKLVNRISNKISKDLTNKLNNMTTKEKIEFLDKYNFKYSINETNNKNK